MTTYRMRTFVSFEGSGFLCGTHDSATLAQIWDARSAAIAFTRQHPGEEIFTGSSTKWTGSIYRFNVSNERMSITVYAVPNTD